MSLLEDIIISDNPSIWHDFGGTSSGYAGITWQMMIWSIITGLLVFIWMAYNLIMFKHKEGDPEHKDALKAGVFHWHLSITCGMFQMKKKPIWLSR